MRFKEAYEGWHAGELTQIEAARLLGMCDRSFRRYLARYEEFDLQGLIDKRIEQVSHRRAHNSEFAVRATEAASAFVEFIGANLGDILCERFERTVGCDNCVRFEALSLQIPADRHRALLTSRPRSTYIAMGMARSPSFMDRAVWRATTKPARR